MAEFLSKTLADWASQLKYEHLTDDAIDAAKRFMYDSVGCAIGGARTEDCGIAEALMMSKRAVGQASVFVSGKKTHVIEAAFLNALMIRAMDYNDIYWKQDPSHPSDIIPAALSICEWKGLSGRDLILGIVLAYEIEMRLCEFALPGIRERGWHHATLTAYAAPLVAGRMLNLDAQKMQHALGISACHHLTLGAAVAGKLTMMKNTVDPMATRCGVEGALLAQGGYTGPENVLDGKEGMVHCLGPDWDYSKLINDLGGSFKISQCGMKAYPTEALTHAPITATLDLIKEHSLKADDVKTVHIESIARAADILSDPSKYNPQSKETADHSLPYCISAALSQGRVTPPEFQEDMLFNPKLREQLNKIKVTANPEFEKLFPEIQPCKVTIETIDGRKLEKRIDIPKGDPRDPMTEEELQVKFDALASPSFSVGRRNEIRRAILALDSMENVSDLMRLCTGDL
ncbi:MAG: MmgE/PrpD family protein [Candidatus Eisenbacteria bacterium]|uniref:MmgE/PrpD family protein n=1 Tax=Eiseniibacteriota bacterium TaxID=2212470 RepID=A0A948W613_UNCEI|nr:MmgE/PrpD family protein [Candidatus Eisenbacteria bacterium]MBU1951163.1 MmgE/PrpD family protein [Candidatus Eisenbacteria bacterium]MBU2690146.1 MmgE/PrpD family protein [Candidatus Eisenbacteria bacterium]